MTGKIRLVDAVLEIVKEVGQNHLENRGRFDIQQGDNPMSTFSIWVSTTNHGIYDTDYEIEIDNMMNRVKIKLGNYPEFDFHNPDSIVLFKAALMQMPIITALRNIRNQLDRMLDANSIY